MTVQNLPIQVIGYWEADGTLKPLRFRYEDEQRQYHTVYVDRITDTRKIDYVGVEALVYLCKGRVDDFDHLYELKYTLRTHKWTLFRQIY